MTPAALRLSDVASSASLVLVAAAASSRSPPASTKLASRRPNFVQRAGRRLINQARWRASPSRTPMRIVTSSTLDIWWNNTSASGQAEKHSRVIEGESLAMMRALRTAEGDACINASVVDTFLQTCIQRGLEARCDHVNVQCVSSDELIADVTTDEKEAGECGRSQPPPRALGDAA